VNGVPAIMMVGNDVPVVGAMPFESYRRWMRVRIDRADLRSACRRRDPVRKLSAPAQSSDLVVFPRLIR